MESRTKTEKPMRLLELRVLRSVEAVAHPATGKILVREPPVREREETEVIVVDGDYIRAQAQQAIETFLAPLLGVYGAATGKRVRLQRRKRDKVA